MAAYSQLWIFTCLYAGTQHSRLGLICASPGPRWGCHGDGDTLTVWQPNIKQKQEDGEEKERKENGICVENDRHVFSNICTIINGNELKTMTVSHISSISI